jgi:hypothetical protein
MGLRRFRRSGDPGPYTFGHASNLFRQSASQCISPQASRLRFIPYPQELGPVQDLDLDRMNHPLDIIERLAASNDWSFDRDGEDEISVNVSGAWAEYQVAVTWLGQMEAMHVASAFDLKVPTRRRTEVLALISLINEQLWLGHFDFWSAENVVMFRCSLLLSGGAEPTDEQAGVLVKTAVETCERYYQAFQFVLWAGKTAREALDGAMMECVGQA